MHVLLCFLAFLLGSTSGYKPVIYMHGIFADGHEGDFLSSFIKKHHPGTITVAIQQFNNLHSIFNDLDTQVKVIGQQMLGIMRQYPAGVHLVCNSQGGLICRGVLERFQHNVDTFIALSSPLAGQYGDTSYLKWLFPKHLKENLYRVFYTSEGQKLISFANYWNDPHHQDMYKNASIFLAPLNLQANASSGKEYKANFVRLKKLVMIGGPDDGVITPWQSSHFGFYDDQEQIVEMRTQQWYKADSFGLKTLDKRKSLVTYVVPGVEHVHWYRNETVLSRYVLPYLT